MKKLPALCLLFLLSFSTLSAQESRPVYMMIPSTGYAFSLDLPGAWNSDQDAADQLGVDYLFFNSREVSSASIVSYGTISAVEDGVPAKAIMEVDIASFREKMNDLDIEPGKNIKVKKSMNIPVQHFTSHENQFYAAIAYVTEPGAIIRLIYVADSPASFEKNYEEFRQMIASYNSSKAPLSFSEN